jgi:probable HAF family extracellular repeat protein
MYSITDLGTLGGNESVASGIDSSGQVVGISRLVSMAVHAFLWRQGAGMQDLGTLGGFNSQARGINNSGGVAGEAETGGNAQHAFLWSQGAGMQDLGTLGGVFSSAAGINDLGDVVGASIIDGARHAFLWSQGAGMRDLGTLGGKLSDAAGINNSGQVVGQSDIDATNQHAFLWSAVTGMQDLGTLGGDFSRATAINNVGQVVGESFTSSLVRRPFIWTAATGMKDLVPIGGGFLSALPYAINDSGEVVGEMSVPNAIRYHAFLFSGGVMHDLNNLIPANSGWELNTARGINSVGQIVGDGMNATERHAFLLTPPPPDPRRLLERVSSIAYITTILVGIVDGQPGWKLPPGGGRPMPEPPPNPIWESLSPGEQDALMGLIVNRMASLINDTERRNELQGVASNLVRSYSGRV